VARVSGIDGKRVVVVGGGVAGLAAAEALCRRGAAVTVVEREARVGGLARSFRHGGVTFDLGPHRFHTEDREVDAVIRDVLGDDLRLIDRSSAVWLYNAYHDWPLTRSSVLKLPPLVMARAFVDLFRRPTPRDESLESYVLSKYGQTLYDIFFKPYTEKFVTYKCTDLHSDWASAGMNRAVIDQRYKFDNLFNVARTTLLPPAVHTKFIYPESGGIDRFAENLARRIEAQGGRVLTGATLAGLELDDDRVALAVADDAGGAGAGASLPCDLLVWTASLPLLGRLLGLPDPGLVYLAELVYNVVIRGGPALPYQWTYYGGAALSFTRASIPSNFNPRNDGPGLSGVCLEIVCQEQDDLWRDPLAVRRELEHDMVRVGLVRGRADVVDVHVERIREAYPVYVIDYPERLARAVSGVSARAANVALLGRTGTFWYNNMDHSIRQALDLVAALDRGTSTRQWNADLGRSRAL
jgi:protoporphyrinogen oxidase